MIGPIYVTFPKALNNRH